ncbi:MAG TPA: hypothetical protein DCO79_11650 [Spirochaeta sp.]|nr:hypothetical protein [Spirochaeta sp.]
MSKRKKAKSEYGVESELSPYQILGISETADEKDIRNAYLQRVKEAPPERNPEEFKMVRKAYGILKDSNMRKKLDMSLFRIFSDIKVDAASRDTLEDLFRERIFHLLLASSDLYIRDFTRFFTSIDNRIEDLH